MDVGWMFLTGLSYLSRLVGCAPVGCRSGVGWMLVGCWLGVGWMLVGGWLGVGWMLVECWLGVGWMFLTGLSYLSRLVDWMPVG